MHCDLHNYTEQHMLVAGFETTPKMVVLLHGIGRTSKAMEPLACHLSQQGYHTLNIDYPSRKKPIQLLAKDVYSIIKPYTDDTYQLYFVTHSMGGILTRQLIHEYNINNVKRIVMLGPPNQGSEVADFLKNNLLFKWFYGPAGQQLTTVVANTDPFPDVQVEVGIIAGNKTIDPISSLILKKSNDGKVTINSTKLKNMKDHITLPVNHALMMRNNNVKKQVLHFLEHGRFDSEY